MKRRNFLQLSGLYLHVNETILQRDPKGILTAFTAAAAKAKRP